MIAKFNEGLSDRKANPSEVAKEMLEAKDLNGSPLFLPEDWKTARQISIFFHDCQQSASNHVVAVTLSDEENVDEEDLIGAGNQRSLRSREYTEESVQCSGSSTPILF